MPETNATHPPATEEIPLDRIRELLRRHAPSFWRDQPMPEDLRLDDQGIGFDSIGLVELLLACERELGIRLPPDLLVEEAMTVGRLHARLNATAHPARE